MPKSKSLTPAHARAAISVAFSEPFDYQLDFYQRAVLYLDTLAQRAQHMIEHKRAGKPSLLDFDDETILDARRPQRPTNYAPLRRTTFAQWVQSATIRR